VTVTQGGQTAVTLDSALTSDDKKGSSIIRVIYDLSFRAVTGGAFPEIFVGYVMINGDADAAGIYPDADDPLDQPGWLGRFQVKATDGANRPLERSSADLRTARKYRGAGDTWMAILDNAAAASGSIIATGLVRSLLRLH